MRSTTSKSLLSAVAGLAAAAVSALCCAGPLLAGAFGLGAAGLAAAIEPLRPLLVACTAFALVAGHGVLRREARLACEPGRECASPPVRRRLLWLLWGATAGAILLVTFPWWNRALLG